MAVLGTREPRGAVVIDPQEQLRLPADRRLHPDSLRFLIFAAILAAWGGLFILRSSFLMGEGRYFTLFDDAMVSMAYAKNLVAGHGLRWTGGATPVEGFSNPLWTFLMTLPQLTGLPLRQRSLPVQVGGLLLMMAVVWQLKRLIVEHLSPPERPASWLPAAVLTSFNFAFAYWSLVGMETPLQALLAILAVRFAYDVVFRRIDRSVALGVVFALAYLTRMDMAPLIAIVGMWVVGNGGLKHCSARRVWLGAAILATAVVGYELFRWSYFHALLPNTYYLKVGSIPLHVRLPRGARVLGTQLHENALVVIAVVAAVVAGGGRRSRTLLPALLLVAYLAYSVWVGGDAWELPDVNLRLNRFVVFLLPLAFALVAHGLERALPPERTEMRRAAVLLVTVVLLVSENGLWLNPRAEENWQRLLLADYPPLVPSNALVTSRLVELEKLVAPGARVVTYWAGIPAYFADYRLVDALGYNDATLARKPLRDEIGWTRYRPGHEKADAAYLMAKRPDAFFQFWNLPQLPSRTPRHYLRRAGYEPVQEFWLRRDSKYLKPGALPPDR